MNILIYFVLIVICTLIFSICIVGLSTKLLFLVKTARKHKRMPEKKKLIVWVVKRIPVVLLAVLSIMVVSQARKFINVPGATAEEPPQTVLLEKYNQVLEEITFQPEVINKEDTVWEHFLADYLHYADYCAKEEGCSIIELRNWYIESIGEGRSVSTVELYEAREDFNVLYGNALIPYVSRNLSEVSGEIPPLEERQNADPALFIEEFALRMLSCTEKALFECLYQTARAADDAYKQLINKNILTRKQEVVFTSFAVLFYQLSIESLDESQYLTRAFIEYKIAEIYFCLYKNGNYNFDQNYNIHFLLSAEAHLKCASKYFELAGTNEDILVKHPYYGAYLAEIQYNLIVLYDCKDKSMIAECYEHAKNYCENVNAKESGVKSCTDIIQKLEKKYKAEEKIIIYGQ